jgi:DNA-binding transcriptional LysR family regulator
LPPYVAAFRRRHPDVHLQLRSVVGSDGIAQLRADQVDLAVGSLLDVPNDLNYEPLQTFDPMLITPSIIRSRNWPRFGSRICRSTG